jgi:hypothetical protein
VQQDKRLQTQHDNAVVAAALRCVLHVHLCTLYSNPACTIIKHCLPTWHIFAGVAANSCKQHAPHSPVHSVQQAQGPIVHAVAVDQPARHHRARNAPPVRPAAASKVHTARGLQVRVQLILQCTACQACSNKPGAHSKGLAGQKAAGTAMHRLSGLQQQPNKQGSGVSACLPARVQLLSQTARDWHVRMQLVLHLLIPYVASIAGTCHVRVQ